MKKVVIFFILSLLITKLFALGNVENKEWIVINKNNNTKVYINQKISQIINSYGEPVELKKHVIGDVILLIYYYPLFTIKTYIYSNKVHSIGFRSRELKLMNGIQVNDHIKFVFEAYKNVKGARLQNYPDGMLIVIDMPIKNFIDERNTIIFHYTENLLIDSSVVGANAEG